MAAKKCFRCGKFQHCKCGPLPTVRDDDVKRDRQGAEHRPDPTPTTDSGAAASSVSPTTIVTPRNGQYRSPPVNDPNTHTEICERLGVSPRVFQPGELSQNAEAIRQLDERDARSREQLADAVMPGLVDKAVAAGVLPRGTKFSGLASKLATQPVDDSPHLIVEARAGTGKTTTLIQGLRHLRDDWRCSCAGNAGRNPDGTAKCSLCDNGSGVVKQLTPSPQQRAVWDAICLSRDKAKTVCFVAFNKAIAEELKRRVPAGVEASTMHSLGFKAINRSFMGKRLNVDEHRVGDIVLDLLGIGPKPDSGDRSAVSSWFAAKQQKQDVIGAVCKLVGLCKMNLADENDQDVLLELAAHYGVELNGSQAEVLALVPSVLAACRNVTDRIDYDDMVWLPIALNLPITKYDLLLVDEAQDLNRCQQELAKRAGRRLILCGDPKQAIYGFAGADAESMPRMAKELDTLKYVDDQFNPDGSAYSFRTEGRYCITLPLTVTRRCGKAIVAEAQKIVPDFEAYETNPEGRVSSAPFGVKSTVNRDNPQQTYRETVQDGDMVLCRCNAPLVSECFKFIRAGRKANVQGRDIGQGLISTIKKLKAKTVSELIERVDDWLASEVRKENAKRNPSENRLQGFEDKRDCIVAFTDGLPATNHVDEVVAKIEMVFTDNKDARGIKLSSIHKAKGLEAHHVFYILGDGKRTFGPPVDKLKDWELGQESNLRYVAITRAIEVLTYVS